MEDKVSIIVPIYNTDLLYLDECIKSIQQQTYSNIEIILVDDGSKKEVADVCDEYSKKDKKIKVIHQQNQGISVARNEGINISTGKWVVFSDSDDWFEKDAIEVMVKNSKDADVVISCFYVDNKPCITTVKTEVLKEEKRKELMDSLFLDENKSFNYVDSSCSKLYLKSFLKDKKITFENKIATIGEDIIFNFEIYNKANKIIFVNANLYHYRMNETSVTHVWDNKFIEKTDRFFEKFVAKFKNEIQENFKEEFDFFIIRQIHRLCTKYIFVKNNRATNRDKYKVINEIVNRDPYKNAIKEINLKKLSLKRKIIVLAIRYKCYFVLKWMFEFKNSLKK